MIENNNLLFENFFDCCNTTERMSLDKFTYYIVINSLFLNAQAVDFLSQVLDCPDQQAVKVAVKTLMDIGKILSFVFFENWLMIKICTFNAIKFFYWISFLTHNLLNSSIRCTG